MAKEIILPELYAALNLPLSAGVKSGDLLFVSGQLALDRKGNLAGKGDVKKQTEQALRNVEEILLAGGSSLEKALKVTVYLADISHFPAMNEVYRTFFRDKFPARTTVQAKLSRDEYLIEIDAVASCS